MTRALLEAGAEVGTRDTRDRFGPLQIAAKHNSTRVAQMLINAGAGLDLPEKAGWTALHFAAQKGAVMVADLLLAAGANPHVRSVGDSETPLHVASAYDSPSVAALLLVARADVNTTDKNGETPLERAAKEGSVKTAELLVFAGSGVLAEGGSNTNASELICSGRRHTCDRDEQEWLERLLVRHMA